MVTVTQIESDGSTGPLTRGVLTADIDGHAVIDFAVATH